MNIYFLFKHYIQGLFILISVGFITKAAFYVINSYQGILPIDIPTAMYAMFWGLRFDISVAALFAFITLFICYLLARIRIYTKWSLAPYLYTASILFMLQMGDWLYFLDANRHVSYEIQDIAATPIELLLTAIGQYSYFFVAATLVVVFLLWLSISVAKKTKVALYNAWLPLGLELEVSLFALLLLSAIFIRGGLQDVPQDPLLAYSLGDSESATIALNGAYMVVNSLMNQDGGVHQIEVKLNANQKNNYQQILQSVKHSPYQISENVNQYNVVFILLESWSARYMQSYGFKEQTTPYFDQLLEQSLSADMMVAGGHRTTEGMFVSFCSAQNPLGQTVANSQLYLQPFACLPKFLKQRGWSSAFFEGTSKNTSGTGFLAQKMGFEHVYGKFDMPQPKYGYNSWGVYDQDEYDFVIDKLKKMPQPFVIGINTTTTHDDQLPQGIKAKFGMDSAVSRRMSVLHFADTALKDFMAKMQKQNFANTLYVIFADHTTGAGGTNLDHYRIPFLVYMPKQIKARRIEGAVAQRDISPTVLNILNIPSPKSFSGQSLLAKDYQSMADYYHSGTIGWVEGDRIVESSVAKENTLKCFNIDYKSYQQKSSICTQSDQLMAAKSKVFATQSQNDLFNEQLIDSNWLH